MKKIFQWIGNNWKPIIFTIVSVGVLVLVGFYNLESITNSKLSPQEVSALQTASSGKAIMDNPLFLPYKLGEYGVIKLGTGSIYLFRVIPAIFGVILVVLFYLLARRWFSPRIAWLSSIMLATSTLFLNYARLAVPDILLPLALLGLMWCAWWVYESKHAGLSLFIAGAILATTLYIPGLVWFTLLAIVAQRRHIMTTVRKVPVLSVLGFLVVCALLLAPLARALSLNPALIKDWLAVPATVDPRHFVQEFIYVPLSLVARALPAPIYNLGRLPYLDILTLCFAVLGAYAYFLRLDLVRTRALVGAIIIAWLLIAFSNTVHIVIILPLIYLTVAAGIMFMLQQWYSVFPKNPIARSIGVVLLSLVIGISIFYNINRYFIAWANSPVTRAVFTEQVPPNLIQ